MNWTYLQTQHSLNSLTTEEQRKTVPTRELVHTLFVNTVLPVGGDRELLVLVCTVVRAARSQGDDLTILGQLALQ